VKIALNTSSGEVEVGSYLVKEGLSSISQYWETTQDQITEIEHELGQGEEDLWGEAEETRPGPAMLGFHLGDRVMITEELDTYRVPKGTPGAYPSQGGDVRRVGLNEVGEIVGLNVDATGAPLSGSMLVKLPDGQELVVFPDEVERV